MPAKQVMTVPDFEYLAFEEMQSTIPNVDDEVWERIIQVVEKETDHKSVGPEAKDGKGKVEWFMKNIANKWNSLKGWCEGILKRAPETGL